LIGLYKSFDAAIEAGLYIIWEETGWKLAASSMRKDTIAADTFELTGFISAITPCFVLLYLTL
jgi:hypothetical protein